MNEFTVVEIWTENWSMNEVETSAHRHKGYHSKTQTEVDMYPGSLPGLEEANDVNQTGMT